MQTSARSIILEGVDRYQVVEPMFEGLRVILSYRGESFTPAYIQGISGAAFRVAGICPCAPTCGTAMQPQDLARTLGYAVEYLPLQADRAGARTRAARGAGADQKRAARRAAGAALARLHQRRVGRGVRV